MATACSRLNCWPFPVSTRRWSSGHVSADSGNSEMMIRRKVHLSFKPLKFAFADVQDAQGTVVFEDVRTILQR